MAWNRSATRAAIGAVCAALSLCVTPAFGGGFFIIGELPSGDTDTKDAALIVFVIGCHKPSYITAKAEGLVAGKRATLPLTLEPLGEGRFLIRRTWPREGVWGISAYSVSEYPITVGGKTFHIRDAAFFLCGSDGRPTPPPPAGYVLSGTRRALIPQRLTPVPETKAQEIDAALRAASTQLAAHEAPTAL